MHSMDRTQIYIPLRQMVHVKAFELQGVKQLDVFLYIVRTHEYKQDSGDRS
jgi:hypothetical protein